ncbi:MAG: excinuclease ABC subunit UvrC [Lentisphaeria bacterium]|nr:excinuclease ABC subunit UvrC [Lentisphaeria bacterium]
MKLFQEFHPSEIPNSPGVYVFRDRFGKVIYVGKARNLKRRLSSYFQPSRVRNADPKLRSLINSIHLWSYETVRSEDEALILESRLIKDFSPHYNILMRDDKRYLLLKIDMNELFPTLKLARIKKPDNAVYFGPFPQGTALKATLEFLLSHFGLRACRDSEPNAETRKHCLKRIVKDCCAPCTVEISREEYMLKVQAALKVLEGDIRELKSSIEERMKEYASQCRFEQAAKMRDVLHNLTAVFGKRNREFARPELPDTSPGISAVEDLQNQLHLKTAPSRIIGFDISNILGRLAVASLVAFKDGKPDRDNYRRFRIRTVDQSDDFAMMAEAIRRHFGRLLKENRPLPDLLLVDGGKGQLSATIKTLVEIGCPPFPVLGLAKKNEEIYLPGRSEPVILSRHTPALRMLQALRDEAHRFAITYHRELRKKEIEKSLLDDIPGVGKIRKKQLLKEFGSVAALRRATPEEIARRISGLGENTAFRISHAIRKERSQESTANEK